LLGTFAAVAVVLATAGLYGVLSYSVSRRTREIGVRSALGATQARLIGLVAREGAAMAAAGLVVGAGAGLAASRAMRSLLYGVSPLDPTTWIAAVVGLLGVVVVAVAFPAWRASRVPPAVALKND
jgi:ABC-type antimicrobial peptide transport system permease subunit